MPLDLRLWSLLVNDSDSQSDECFVCFRFPQSPDCVQSLPPLWPPFPTRRAHLISNPHTVVMTDRMDEGPDAGAETTVAAVAADSSSSSGAAAAAAASPSASLSNPLLLPLLLDSKLRFILELEFVEMLASPHYLHFLAQSRYLSNPSFLNYLAYLQYWHEPAYLPFIAHPHCLYFLDLLHVSDAFRAACLNPAYINLIHEQTFFHWRSARYNTFIDAETKRDAARAKKAAATAAAAKEEQQQVKSEHGDATQPPADAQKGQHGS